MKRLILTVLISVSLGAKAQTLDNFFSKANSFFGHYVIQGKVSYKDLKTNPAELNSLMDLASKLDLSAASDNEAKAFWINAYNLAVIQGVVANFPINSPLDVNGFFDRNTYNLAGKSITLNDIENKQIREPYNDARIHFVLVCGANGCPPIIGKAYKPATLDSQLQKQTKLALNNPKFIQVKGTRVAVSQIFKWYKQDFGKNDKEIVAYINSFRAEPLLENSKLSYYEYNWNLNIK